ncbi:MAG: heavy-metal-associated domain-containing protein [Chitinophagaceae bacterium]|nr:heavy-metal-associated domain-containing protein [Chitinophagaceae bacterium]
MKRVLLLVLITVGGLVTRAQDFKTAQLQATGLTCAMCSNAINKALLELPYVESVKSEIRTSSFAIVFKAGQDVNIDGIRKAVEDAGFSVGSLKLTGRFNAVKLGDDAHVMIGKEAFHFLDVNNQVLEGDQTITVLDKGFITAKQFKKITNGHKMACVASGKAASCCAGQGIAAEARVYHVTI